MMVIDAEGKTLQTNERSWTSFPLLGTIFKAGRATSLAAAGSPIGVILTAGEWKSSAFLPYCQADEVSVSAVLEVVCAEDED